MTVHCPAFPEAAARDQAIAKPQEDGWSQFVRFLDFDPRSAGDLLGQRDRAGQTNAVIRWKAALIVFVFEGHPTPIRPIVCR